MEKEFLPYQESLELKELGFKEKCAAHYVDEDDLELKWKIYRNLSFNTDNCVQAPLYQQAFRWFREKYNLDHFVQHYIDGSYETYFSMTRQLTWNVTNHETYEEAERACLKKLIEIAKQL
jgi:hypothetical protein